MKRKDQMKVLSEILDVIDQGDSAGDHCLTYYDMAMSRLGHITDQYPSEDPYCQLAQRLWGQAASKHEAFCMKSE